MIAMVISIASPKQNPHVKSHVNPMQTQYKLYGMGIAGML